MAAKFIVEKKGKNFYFNLKAGNGQVVLTSQGYGTKAAAMNGIASVKKNSKTDGRFERKMSKAEEPFFTLVAENKEIIGKSEMYASSASMEKGINSVKTNAPKAAVDDRTEA
jgi:uncharacterized protein